MDANTFEALKGSVEKWNRIITQNSSDLGPRNCPLCLQFFYAEPQCRGCPVYAKTGQEGCACTPYDLWDWHHTEVHYNLKEMPHVIAGCATCIELATAERDFLAGLLPGDGEVEEKGE